MDPIKLSNLIIKSIKDELSNEERQLLEEWRSASEANEEQFKKLYQHSEALEKVEDYKLFDADKSWRIVEDQITKVERARWFSTKYLRYAASVIVPLLLAAVIFFWLNPQAESNLANIDAQIQPGSKQAVLTLANGTQIDLMDNEFEEEVKQGVSSLTNSGNLLSYRVADSEPAADKELIYNELTTPNGGIYEIQLSDGTKVTLNAGSTLKYPVDFEDDARRVTLSGEAFFEVTHTGVDFIVATENQNVRVLGTKFNVISYSTNAVVATTLVEGKVQVETSAGDRILAPGEQSLWEAAKSTIEIRNVNTEQYTSWRNGKLEFNKEGMEAVMSRLARWYDFQYRFENEAVKAYHFTARIDNDQPISSVIEMLEASSDIQFELHDNTIVIK